MPGLINFPEDKIFSGANGQLIDARGGVINETQEFTAVLNIQQSDVKVVGSLWTAKKEIGLDGSGTMKLHMISVALSRAIAEAASSGRPLVTQFIGATGNDVGDTAKVLLQNVRFSGKVDLIKFQAQTLTELDLEFTFVGFRYL